MITNYDAYKYETPYKGTFLKTQCWTNVMVTLNYGVTKIGHNIRRIKPYLSDANVEDITTEKYV